MPSLFIFFCKVERFPALSQGSLKCFDPGLKHYSQNSTDNPGTRSKSRRFLVTNVTE